MGSAAQHRHPGNVTVHEVQTLEGLPTIVADFIEGVPLKDLLEVRQLTFRETATLMAEVAEAVEHMLAYALIVLFREAAAPIPEVAEAEVSTLRQRLWKVGAVVRTSTRRIWFHFSETWPDRDLWTRVCQAVVRFVERLRQGGAAVPEVRFALPM
jgi:hypothetical protein